MKLLKKQIILAMIFAGVSAVFSMIFVAAFAALLHNAIPFIPLWVYGVSAFVSIWTCVGLRKLVRCRGYVTKDELALARSDFWIDAIREKKFLTRAKAYLMLLPYAVVGIVGFVLLGVFYNDITSLGELNYIGFATLFALVSSVAAALIVYALISVLSFKVCPSCGCVNSFIFDEEAEYINTTGYASAYKSSVLPASKGAPYYWRKGASNGDRLTCHCANCGGAKPIVEVYDSGLHWL